MYFVFQSIKCKSPWRKKSRENNAHPPASASNAQLEGSSCGTAERHSICQLLSLPLSLSPSMLHLSAAQLTATVGATEECGPCFGFGVGRWEKIPQLQQQGDSCCCCCQGRNTRKCTALEKTYAAAYTCAPEREPSAGTGHFPTKSNGPKCHQTGQRTRQGVWNLI